MVYDRWKCFNHSTYASCVLLWKGAKRSPLVLLGRRTEERLLLEVNVS